MGRTSVFKRFIGFALMLALGATQILPPAVAEAAGVSGPAAILGTANPIQQLKIPNSLGTVEEIFQGRKDEFVIFIQDAHANLSAQKSIASIIETLSSELNISLLAEEGAEGTIDTSLLRAMPVREITKAVLERHLSRGRMNGAEFYASTSDRKMNFVGVDRRKLYLQNFSELITVLDRQDQVLQALLALNTSLKNIQVTIFSKALKEFNDPTKRYASGNIEMGAFLKELAKCAEVRGVDISRYPNIKTLIEFSGNKVSKPVEMNPSDIRREMDDLIAALKSHYAGTTAEKELIQIEEYFALFERGFSLELSSDEFQRLEKLHRIFQKKGIETILKETAEKSRLKLSIKSESVRVVGENYEHIASFYRTAKKRDGEMAKRLFIELDRQLEGGAILIAGGFHREGITGKLRRKGISYAVISPAIAEFTSHEDYLRLMEQSRTLIEKRSLSDAAVFASPRRGRSNLRIAQRLLRRAYGAPRNDISDDTLSVPSQLGFPQLRSVFLSEVVLEIFVALQRNPQRYGFDDSGTMIKAILASLRAQGVFVSPDEELLISESDRLLAAERAVSGLDHLEEKGVALSLKKKRNLLVSAVRGTAARFSNQSESVNTISAGFGAAQGKEPEDPIGAFIGKQIVRPIRNDATIQNISIRHLDGVLYIEFFVSNGDMIHEEQIVVEDRVADDIMERIKIWSAAREETGKKKKADAEVDLNGEVKIANLRLEVNITEDQTTHSHTKEMITIFVTERSNPAVGFGAEGGNQGLIRMGVAQINLRVGDLIGNYKKILENIERAVERDVDVIAFPELTLTGYPPQDLLRKVHFIRQNKALLKSLIPRVRNITAVVGFVDFDESGNLYNAVATISNGELKGIYRKRDLPNYGVFDEKRYFTPGREGEVVDFEGKPLNQRVFDLDGKLICVNVCEDIWIDGGVFLTQSSLGAKLLINTSASPFRQGVGQVREDLLKKRANETGATIVYTNSVGGQDMLIFDGGSLVMAPDGKILERGKEFEEELIVTDIPVVHSSPGTDQASISISGGKPTTEKKPLEQRDTPKPLSDIERIYKAIVLGLRDYAGKNKEKFGKAVFGLSGGIDSAVVAVLAQEAFGPENVTAYSLPTRFNSDETRADARKVAKNLGVHFKEISIQTIFFTYLFDLAKLGGIPRLRRWFAFALYGLSRIAPIKGLVKAAENLLIRTVGTPEENLQARIRMSFLMTMANRSGAILLSTSDKSETAVDYTTLYGDMAGGFAPILDLLKTQAYELARYINLRDGRETIPVSIITRKPTGELNENQWDSDLLPPYELLDQILEAYLERDESIEEMSKKWPRGEVEWVVQQVDGSESKRKQGPPGLKISRSHLGLERRMPINHSYREQEVDRHLEHLAEESAHLIAPVVPANDSAPSPDSGFGVLMEPAAVRQETQENIIAAVRNTVNHASAQSLEEMGSFKTLVFSRAEDFERFEKNVLKYKPEILARVFGGFTNVVAGWDVSGLRTEEKNALWLRFARIFSRRGQKIFVGTDDREIFASIRAGTEAALLGPETEYLLNKVEDRYKLYLIQKNGDHFIAVVSEALRLAYLSERISSISA